MCLTRFYTKTVWLLLKQKSNKLLKKFLLGNLETLKTNNNFDKVLSIASLIEPYDEGPDPCEPYKETCERVGMCMGCYDGYVYSIDWRASYNLRSKNL